MTINAIVNHAPGPDSAGGHARRAANSDSIAPSSAALLQTLAWISATATLDRHVPDCYRS
ncbi:hypothetical protein BOS5A_230080 [Bosea sp. EC-HK365B]|nr:hypothetical protein BOSE21B_90156 [Bosea sp. 21B]CAD5299078.1 hypothetical protein BOSE7B_60507 [Bosea sp. 7B]VVT60803.1 hypothetical protein BOS5A_230080 [Bosea sp. EC-HK365B]VXB40838.1 hypothetical protein BOSE127_110506 [Bosea sp. 127]VXC74113.1 hypothetical protein BOSE29B_80151 [Bosea sp. 29B]